MVCFVPPSGYVYSKRSPFCGTVCPLLPAASSPSCPAKRSRFVMNMDSARDNRQQETGSDRGSWREDMRMLLDPSLSLSAKSVLLQDMSKRAPEIGKEAFEDVCSSAGLEGVPAVMQQMSEDVVPDLLSNGPQYATEVGKRVPEAISNAVGTIQSGVSLGGGAPGAPEEIMAAVGQELRNAFNRTPEGLETPEFETLSQHSGFELRRYSEILVAETPMVSEMSPQTSEVASASSMGTSFNTLAKYLFGSNSSGGPMAMTTPVVMDYCEGQDGKMSFVLPSKYSSDIASAPQPVGPVSDTVDVAVRQGGVYAVAEFTGFATVGEVRRQLAKLKTALEEDGIVASSDEYTVLVYNGPGTAAFLRRNELCLRVIVDSDTDQNEMSDANVLDPEVFASRAANDGGGFVDVGATTD